MGPLTIKVDVARQVLRTHVVTAVASDTVCRENMSELLLSFNLRTAKLVILSVGINTIPVPYAIIFSGLKV